MNYRSTHSISLKEVEGFMADYRAKTGMTASQIFMSPGTYGRLKLNETLKGDAISIAGAEIITSPGMRLAKG